ncbi:MAG TPA: DinB family protein [Thermoanaerobaculia bacterium]|nr:DinB family protein [Thermoanaerobaculia bacterium]
MTGRPETGEYAPYAADDIALVPGDDAIEALRACARDTVALFGTFPEERIAYAEGKWTLKEVLGHLIDDERIFAYRALCVARADPRPLAGFDEKEYVAATTFESRTFAQLLREYDLVRESTVAFFASLTPEEWLRRGTVNGYQASVRGLAFHIAGHELHHLRVVRERYL